MNIDRVKQRISKMVILGIKQFGDPYYQGFAAQIAFYLLLSVVPTVILLSQFLGFLNINNLNMLDTFIDRYITPEMGRTLKGLLANRSSVGNNIVLIVTAIWAASRAQFSLMRIANYTYSLGRTTGNFFTERLRSLKTMFFFIFTIVFVMVIMVYGKDILLVTMGQVIESYTITSVWESLRWPLTAVMYFLLMIYLYYILPEARHKLKDIVPGSVFAAVGMMVVTMVYSTYTRKIVTFSVIYGSLSSIAALMFWFYLLAWVLVLGVLLNRVLMDTREV